MAKIKIIFFGSNQLSAACLSYLLASNEFDVLAIVCQPDKPVGRGKKIIYSPVKEIAIKHHILCLQPEKINEIYDHLKSFDVRLGVCVAYGQFLPEKILQLFDLGVINVHPSLLPKFRGAAPIQHAIWNGKKVSAITIMKMVKAMDAGPYCCQKKFEIKKTDDYGTIMNLVIAEAPKLLYENLKLIFNQAVEWINQDETKKSFAPVLTKAQEKINWNSSPQQVVNHIRAFSPTPGTYSFYNEKDFIKFYAATVGNHHFNHPVGTINEITTNYICVNVVRNNCVHITEFLIPGKKRTKIQDYQGILPFKVGDCFIVDDRFINSIKKPQYASKTDFLNFFDRPEELWFLNDNQIKMLFERYFKKTINQKSWRIQINDDFEIKNYFSVEFMEFDVLNYYRESVITNTRDKDYSKFIEGKLIDEQAKQFLINHVQESLKINTYIDFNELYQGDPFNLEERAIFCKKIITNTVVPTLFLNPVFIAENCVTIPNAIIYNGNFYELIDVKGLTTLKRIHVLDLYYQVAVIKKNLALLNNVSIALIAYERKTKNKASFTITNLMQEENQNGISDFWAMLKNCFDSSQDEKEPDVIYQKIIDNSVGFIENNFASVFKNYLNLNNQFEIFLNQFYNNYNEMDLSKKRIVQGLRIFNFYNGIPFYSNDLIALKQFWKKYGTFFSNSLITLIDHKVINRIWNKKNIKRTRWEGIKQIDQKGIKFSDKLLSLNEIFWDIMKEINHHEIPKNLNFSLPYGYTSYWKSFKYFSLLRKVFEAKGYYFLGFSKQLINWNEGVRLSELSSLFSVYPWYLDFDKPSLPKIFQSLSKIKNEKNNFFFNALDEEAFQNYLDTIKLISDENLKSKYMPGKNLPELMNSKLIWDKNLSCKISTEAFISYGNLKKCKVYFYFKTISHATRIIDNSLPFMHIITQCSILKDDGNGIESECLNLIVDPKNITNNFYKQIIDALYQSNIKDYNYVVYEGSFEKNRLIELKYILDNDPEYCKKIDEIIANFYDLEDFFSLYKNNIIMVSLKGFSSLKAILNLIPKRILKRTKTINYNSLKIVKTNKTKVITSLRFFNKITDEKWKLVSKKLQKYCENNVRSIVAVEYFIEYLLKYRWHSDDLL